MVNTTTPHIVASGGFGSGKNGNPLEMQRTRRLEAVAHSSKTALRKKKPEKKFTVLMAGE